MKLRVLALMTIVATALHVSAFAVDTELEGVYSGFLKQDKSPYFIKSTLVVPEGKSILIEAGATLKFAEGAGLDIRGGSMAIVGEESNPVQFMPADGVKSWKGVSIMGAKKSEVRNLVVKHAENAFVVESGSLDMANAFIDGSTNSAIYVRNGDADIQHVNIKNSRNVGIWTSQKANVKLESSTLDSNHVAVVAGAGSDIQMLHSEMRANDIAVFNYGHNKLSQSNSTIEANQVGYLSKDLPSNDFARALGKNRARVGNDLSVAENDLGEEPRNPYANGKKFYAMEDTESDGWNISGNVGLEVGYHKVLTRKNDSNEDYVFGDDTVKVGSHYKNYFQVPGLFANWTANMQMESPTGQKLEFVADFSNDTWNHFYLHTLQAIYSDSMQTLSLGDFSLNAGETYLSGINAFGGMYELNLFKNSANEPLFVGTAFGGEVREPKLAGHRDRDAYNVYIDDDAAEPQNMVAGGRVRWNMHRRFNGTLGFIGGKDYLKDPFLRDGQPDDLNTASPLTTSRNLFADGNWLFFPGDIKLNGQIAIGAADTVNAAKVRAMNQVFTDAGLNSSEFSTLNRLVSNPQKVNALTREELEEIFGDNNALTLSEMRAQLKAILTRASAAASSAKNDDDDMKPTSSDFWNWKHMAVAGSYQWSSENTFIEGFLRYVGKEYYSAGSQDLLQNTRRIGGNLRQRIFDFWKLSFGYTMDVENAAHEGGAYNIFGMGEGTKWGMFSGAESDWLEEHEQDENRTLYIHDAYLGNDFKLNKNISLFVKYAVDYRTRSTAQRLHANYSVSSGIYNDSWFSPRNGDATMDVIDGKDTLKIDSARWAKYYALSDEEYLATQFDEKLLKNMFQLELTFNLPMNVLKVGGVWTFRTDCSKFEQDDLLDGFDFSDETYGILGYYFHGTDFFEQRYPVSLATTVGDIKNNFSITPRYKTYNRNDMTEFEWTLNENLSFPLMENFMEVTLNGGLRQDFLDYEIDDVKYSEEELDIDGSATLRLNHTDALYSTWTLGTVLNYRPDNLEDQYKDLYVTASLNYAF